MPYLTDFVAVCDGGRFNRTVPAFHGVNPAQQAFMEDVVQYVPGPQAWDKYMADALGK